MCAPISKQRAVTSSSSTTCSGRTARAAKNWLLVQTRADLVTENADLMQRWRPLARNFDIFFGLEAHTSPGLKLLNKDAEIDKSIEAVRIARELGFGVTGNFIIDPDFTEQ